MPCLVTEQQCCLGLNQLNLAFYKNAKKKMAEETEDISDEVEQKASSESFSVEESETSKDVHMKNALVRN